MSDITHSLKLILTAVWVATGLFACSRSPGDTIPTLTAPSQLSPTDPELTTATRPLPPANTFVPVTPTSSQPTPTPCQLPTQSTLAVAWNIEELGCPITSGAAAVNTAYAPFEGGQMLWRGDTDMIYVLYNDGRWASYSNEWHEGDPTFTCGEEDPTITPIRGFGRVWCDYPDVGEELGAMTAAEIGDSASAVQDFVNGTILAAPFGGLFVLVGEDGVWRRVGE
jgi:hypothetical protein